MLEEIRSHRDKDYAGAALPRQHMQLGFLNHGLMISRMHYMLNGEVTLERWSQGGRLARHKVEVLKVRTSKRDGDLFLSEADEMERLPVERDGIDLPPFSTNRN